MRVRGNEVLFWGGEGDRCVLRFERVGGVVGLGGAGGGREVGLAAGDEGVGRGVLRWSACGAAYFGVAPAFVEGGLLRAVSVGRGGGGFVASVPVKEEDG